MYYILDRSVKLKKWKGSRFIYMLEGEPFPFCVSERVYQILRSCDGKTALEPDDLLSIFERRGMIRPCEKGEYELQDGQVEEYSNYWFKGIDWAITDRCDCNCLHCFHAADNERGRDEFSREDASSFLKEAADCGIRAIRITGGEPTLYPYLREVIKEMRSLGLNLDDLVTNGALVDESLVSFIKGLHPRARMFFSFDGIGVHDWMRQRKGSEEQVKRAIQISKAGGMGVKINMNANRRNREVIPESVKMLEEMEVDSVRIIRTSESPRWQINEADYSLTSEEYYEFSLDLAQQYKKLRLRVPVYIWQSLGLDGGRNKFNILAEKSCTGEYRENAPLCQVWRDKVCVQANGEIMNCEPMGGWYEFYGISMGNIKHGGLKQALTRGPVLDYIRHTVKEKKETNPSCGACRYFGHCHGGCPVLSILTNGSPLASDQFKCDFFEKGYYERFIEAKKIWES